MTDLMEGITSKTKKDDLVERLKEAGRRLGRYEKTEKTQMRAIEKRVREANRRPEELRQIVLLGTRDDWKETLDFLNQWGDYLPPSLARLREGVSVLAAEEGIPTE